MQKHGRRAHVPCLDWIVAETTEAYNVCPVRCQTRITFPAAERLHPFADARLAEAQRCERFLHSRIPTEVQIPDLITSMK